MAVCYFGVGGRYATMVLAVVCFSVALAVAFVVYVQFE